MSGGGEEREKGGEGSGRARTQFAAITSPINKRRALNALSSNFAFPLPFPAITATPAAVENKRKIKAR